MGLWFPVPHCPLNGWPKLAAALDFRRCCPKEFCLPTARYDSRAVSEKLILSEWLVRDWASVRLGDRSSLRTLATMPLLGTRSEHLRHSPVTSRRSLLILAFLGSLLSTRSLQAQATATLLVRFPIQISASPNSSARCLSLQLPLHNNNDFAERFQSFPAGIYSRRLFAVAPEAYRFPTKKSMDLTSFTSAQLSSHFGNWPAESFKTSGAIDQTYRTAPYAMHASTPNLEQYVRHIPAAGPMIVRICQETKAHPRITRALSMFRPDF